MCLGFFCFFIYLFAFLHSWHLLFINFFLGIIALNAAVLCCWRIPSMQRSMLKYFTSNPASSEFTCATRSCPLLCLQCVHFFSPLLFLFQKHAAFPWLCPPSVTTPSSTWWPTCMSYGYSPQGSSLFWGKSNFLQFTCLLVSQIKHTTGV